MNKFVIAAALVAFAAAPAMAANATHPYANCDKKIDNCGPTGNETTDQLNAAQLGNPGTPMGQPMPMNGQAMPMNGQAMPMNGQAMPMNGQAMPMNGQAMPMGRPMPMNGQPMPMRQ